MFDGSPWHVLTEKGLKTGVKRLIRLPTELWDADHAARIGLSQGIPEVLKSLNTHIAFIPAYASTSTAAERDERM